MSNVFRPTAGGLVLALALSSGCATKRYVRDRVSPIEQRTQELERKNQEAMAQIAQLEEKTTRGLSRVEERAMSAENRATQAGRTAEEARQGAERASELAQQAQQMGQRNQERLGELAARLENSDKFRLLAQETVLFGFNQSTLTPESRQKLEALAARLSAYPNYVVEVAGYTDPTGPQDYNLTLSRRRADTVVRSLVSLNVPLRRIYTVGLGESESAASPTETGAPSPAAARRLARRVEIKVFVPEAALPAARASTETAANRP